MAALPSNWKTHVQAVALALALDRSLAPSAAADESRGKSKLTVVTDDEGSFGFASGG